MSKALVILFTLCPVLLQAQEIYVKNYLVSDGLPSNNVYYVMQDSKGFIWFCTDLGISKFNGYEFKNLTIDDGLPDDEVFQLHEDKEGRFWPVTLNGVIAYLDKEETFYLEPHTKNQIQASRMMKGYCELHDSGIALAKIGVGIVRIKDDKIVEVTKDVNPQYIWAEGNDMMVLESNTVTNNTTGERILTLPLQGHHPARGGHHKGITAISDGLDCHLIKDGNVLGHFQIPSEYREIICICLLDKTLWLGTRNGVVAYDLKTNALTSHFLDGIQVSGVLLDNEGNYWFSSLNNGVYLWPLSAVKKLRLKKGSGLQRINAISFDENERLWLGHDQNQYSIHTEGDSTQYFSFKARSLDNVTSFRFLQDHSMVISKTKVLDHKNKHQAFDIFINDINTMGDNIFLMGSAVSRLPIDSFFALGPIKTRHARLTRYLRTKHLMIPEAGMCSFKMNDSTLFIGTTNGVYKALGNNGSSIERHLSNEIKTSVNAIKKYGANGICVATRGEGLFIETSEGVERIGLKSGLPTNNCQEVYVDNDNMIWACFGNQLFSIIKENQQWTAENYSKKLGLANQKIRVITSHDNKLFLGTDHGLLYFDKLIEPRQPELPLFLDSVVVDGIRWTSSMPIKMSYKYNSIQVFYTALNYSSHGDINYTYLISGLDTAYNHTKSRSIKLRSLPYGEYRLEIAANTEKGGQAMLAPISFEVQKPLYLKWWFWLSLLIALGAIGGLSISIRLRIIKQSHDLEKKRLIAEKEKNEIEKELAELQEKALRMQMNPHFVFNALNTIKGFYAEKRSSEADKYIVRFSKLLRVILEAHGSEISLEKEIESLKLYLELLQIRYNHKFDFEFHVPSDINVDEIEIPSMMLQPFVENAVIHGLAPKDGRGKLDVYFNSEQGELRVKIKDNGVGRSYYSGRCASDHESAATGITEKRLELFNQLNRANTNLKITDLVDAENNANGTIVEIIMDMHNEWE